MDYQVFISYSGADLHLVDPIVRLLRGLHGIVFHDVDSIRAGARWSEELDAALDAAHTVVVFWCWHSADSEYVQYEYTTAIHAEKDVLPVIIDGTPVPVALAAYQWVDFSELLEDSHGRPPGLGGAGGGAIPGVLEWLRRRVRILVGRPIVPAEVQRIVTRELGYELERRKNQLVSRSGSTRTRPI